MTHGVFFTNSVINWSTNIDWSWATLWTTLIFMIAGYLIGSVLVTQLYILIFRSGDNTYVDQNGKKRQLKRYGTSMTAKAFGVQLAILTFVWDAAKPIIFFWAFMWPLFNFLPDTFGHAIVSLGLLSVLIGHLWPIYWKFKGGVGVATAFGIVMLINWMAGLIGFTIWLIIATLLSDSGIGGFFGTFFGVSLMFIPVMLDNNLIFSFFRQDAQYIYMFVFILILMFGKFYSVRYFKEKIREFVNKNKKAKGENN